MKEDVLYAISHLVRKQYFKSIVSSLMYTIPNTFYTSTNEWTSSQLLVQPPNLVINTSVIHPHQQLQCSF